MNKRARALRQDRAQGDDTGMRIMGIDPGLATIGIGVIESEHPHDLRPIDWCAIETPVGLPLAERLQDIAKDLADLLEEFQPDLAVVERLFFAVNAQSALEVAQARGVILSTLAASGLTVIEPSPLELKLAITGDGKADKTQMQAMVARTLALNEIPSPVDAADALALAIFGAVRSTAQADVSGLRR
jgi:crossover junction endodeoxyribonuclease RuvC